MKFGMSEATKHPIVRKGQRKPYSKATASQIEQRIQAAGLLHFCGFSKTQIHQVFRERFGVEWRQTDRYMAYARARNESLGSAQV